MYRLSISDYRSRLVLKGGMLLAAFDERRPTADVDLLAQMIANDVEVIKGVVRECSPSRSTTARSTSVLVDLATARQPDWARFLARSGLDDSAPPTLVEAIQVIAELADPILTGDVSTGLWDPAARR